MRCVLVAALSIFIGLGGCVRVRPLAAEPKLTEHHIPRARDEVFDAAVAVGQRTNLDVPVLEKQSGFLRFEYTALQPGQLDRYCEYPYVDKKTSKPFETFSQWSRRATGEGASVTGLVQLVLVLSAEGSGATNVTVRERCEVHGDWGPKGFKHVRLNECNSLGVLEHEFVEGIESRLGLR
jgi:hypothetical protein